MKEAGEFMYLGANSLGMGRRRETPAQTDLAATRFRAIGQIEQEVRLSSRSD